MLDCADLCCHVINRFSVFFQFCQKIAYYLSMWNLMTHWTKFILLFYYSCNIIISSSSINISSIIIIVVVIINCRVHRNSKIGLPLQKLYTSRLNHIPFHQGLDGADNPYVHSIFTARFSIDGH